MDFVSCTGLDLWEFIEGRGSARRAEPFDPHQTDWWKEGYRHYLANEGSKPRSKASSKAPASIANDFLRPSSIPSPTVAEAQTSIGTGALGGAH